MHFCSFNCRGMLVERKDRVVVMYCVELVLFVVHSAISGFVMLGVCLPCWSFWIILRADVLRRVIALWRFCIGCGESGLLFICL